MGWKISFIWAFSSKILQSYKKPSLGENLNLASLSDKNSSLRKKIYEKRPRVFRLESESNTCILDEYGEY